MIIAVRSASALPCTVSGYPNVRLLDAAGSALPFTYVIGEGQYVTHRRPRPVTLGGARLAYFLVAKYRCDIGVGARATAMNVVLPGQGTIHSVPTGCLRGAFGFCAGGPMPDPGNTITISPFEATVGHLIR